jgi:hypothetical protein
MQITKAEHRPTGSAQLIACFEAILWNIKTVRRPKIVISPAAIGVFCANVLSILMIVGMLLYGLSNARP